MASYQNICSSYILKTTAIKVDINEFVSEK